MSIEDLVGRGSIHAFDAKREEIARAMEIARRDLAVAERTMAESLDWAYTIAYNAVLQACRAYMFHCGYRPAAAEGHRATIQFMRLAVDEPQKKSVEYFDRVRRKRHRTLYDEPGLVSEREAKELLKGAGEFLAYVETNIEDSGLSK